MATLTDFINFFFSQGRKKILKNAMTKKEVVDGRVFEPENVKKIVFEDDSGWHLLVEMDSGDFVLFQVVVIFVLGRVSTNILSTKEAFEYLVNINEFNLASKYGDISYI
ncbi:MAG: hypothetical protein V3U92_17490 [Cellulophaga sp.]